MKLIITRHGETNENKNKICQGQGVGTLSEEGIEQAKKLALRLKDQKIDAIYSSDLERAVNTAKEIVKYHPNLELNLDKRLRERYFGKQEGKRIPDDWDWKNIPDFAESNKKFCERVKEFTDDIYERHKSETILVVCHGGTKIAFFNVIHNKPVEDFTKWELAKNTAVSEFTINEDGKHEIHTVNDTEHLK